MTEPPPMPPQQAKKPERPRVPAVLLPAKRVVTASTTRNRLIAPSDMSQDIDSDGKQP